MTEYISREKLKRTLKPFVIKKGVMENINDIPSADVRENIHGEWIKIQSGDKDFPESIVCSKCKNENSHLDFNEHKEPIGKVFVTSKFCLRI